jgi:hypothetical protein
MTVRRWLGKARAQSQVRTFTFAGAWVAGETVTFGYGARTWVYTLTSGVIATFLPLLVTAYNALAAADYPEHVEQTAGGASPNLTLTAATPGKPFTATVSTNSAAGTVNGGASSTGTATAANAGPNSWGTAANFSGGVLPANNDTVSIDPDAQDDILYDLDATAAVTGLTVNDTGSVLVGLPSLNEDAAAPYPEYRPQYLQTAGGTVNLGGISGAQSNRGTDRFKHDAGATACTWNVYRTGEGRDADLEAALLKGTNAANALNVSGQSQVGVAVFGGEAATLLTLRATGGGAFVRLGAAVTLGTVNQDGGVVEVNGAVAAALNHSTAGGTTTVNGAGAVAQVTALGGTVVYNTTGTLGGDTVLMNGAVLDFEQGQGAVAVTNPIDCYSGAVPLDRLRRVNAGGNFVVDYNGFDPGLGLGANVRVTRSAVA